MPVNYLWFSYAASYPFLTADINYQELSNRSLTFDPSNTESTVNILIIATNETLVEEDKEFIVNLSFPGERIPRVVLEPDNATVTIFEINGQSIVVASCEQM